MRRLVTFRGGRGLIALLRRTATAAKTAASALEYNSSSSLETSPQQCNICRETLGEPGGPDGDEAERAYILPCSHIFGHICITRWLETSPHHNCPTCRRSMIYQDCKHPIEPLEASKTPRCIASEDMPERCLLCRQGGVWGKRLTFLKERQRLEEAILMGLGSFLPTTYGSMGWSGDGVWQRIEDSRRRLQADVELTRILLEKKIGKAW